MTYRVIPVGAQAKQVQSFSRSCKFDTRAQKGTPRRLRRSYQLLPLYLVPAEKLACYASSLEIESQISHIRFVVNNILGFEIESDLPQGIEVSVVIKFAAKRLSLR